MKVTVRWLYVLGLSICLAGAFPAAAQRGRGGGGGMARGGGMGQTNRQGNPSPSSGGVHNTERAGGMTASQAVERNPQLSSRLQTLLPAGTNVPDAAAGFKNTGQFIAAAHVSHNLGIPFADLKNKMLTGDSLGKAVQTLKPDLPKSEVRKEVKKAQNAAKGDMEKMDRPQEQ
ncbi:MAG: hypothetical protein LLG20_19095 [Acidobacteriales bacterium]|nr:hypothetical protein [Terriglobales bacterium]